MTDSTTGNPDEEIIEKLIDTIMTVQERRKILRKRHDAIREDLAALLCPFAEGELVRIPYPSHAGDHATGCVRAIWFDPRHGYQLCLDYDDGGQGALSGYQNDALEMANGKEPVLIRERMDALLRPFCDPWYDFS